MADELAKKPRLGGLTPRRIFTMVFIVVATIVYLTSVAITWILPETYASTARITVDTTGADAYFFETIFERIKSEPVLTSAIDKLNLSVSWSKRYDKGQVLTPAETLEMLKQRISVNTIRNTKLITITVYSDDSSEAAQIANAIAKSYNDYLAQLGDEKNALSSARLHKDYDDRAAQIQSLNIEVDALRQALTNSDPAGVAARKLVYENKRGELAKLTEIQTVIAANIKQTELDAKIPQNPAVTITDPAEPSRVPVRPNKTLNIVIGAVMGIFWGAIAGGVAVLINQQLKKRLGIRLAKP